MSDIKLACDVAEQVRAICDKHGNQPGELINILQEAQHLHGYLPEEMQRLIAAKLNVPVSRVYGVVTFYTFFTMTPKGKHPISVCMGTACYVRGSEKLLEEFKRVLGIEVGETTPDGKFSLDCLRCGEGTDLNSRPPAVCAGRCLSAPSPLTGMPWAVVPFPGRSLLRGQVRVAPVRGTWSRPACVCRWRLSTDPRQCLRCSLSCCPCSLRFDDTADFFRELTDAAPFQQGCVHREDGRAENALALFREVAPELLAVGQAGG